MSQSLDPQHCPTKVIMAPHRVLFVVKIFNPMSPHKLHLTAFKANFLSIMPVSFQKLPYQGLTPHIAVNYLNSL